MGGLSFFGDGLFAYLSGTTTGRKIADAFIVASVFTWIAGAYLIATNYPALKTVFASPIDMKGLVQLDKSINDILTITMSEAGFDRAALSRFHNSVADLQGRHFVYESRSNEVVQPGVSMISALRQNLLVSMINVWAQSFVKNECVYMTDIGPTDQFYEFFRQIGTKSAMKCPVYNTQGVLVGYIDMEFTTKSMSLADMKKLEPKVREAAAKIGAILSLRSSD
jgi:hypothetical protein